MLLPGNAAGGPSTLSYGQTFCGIPPTQNRQLGLLLEEDMPWSKEVTAWLAELMQVVQIVPPETLELVCCPLDYLGTILELFWNYAELANFRGNYFGTILELFGAK